MVVRLILSNMLVPSPPNSGLGSGLADRLIHL